MSELAEIYARVAAKVPEIAEQRWPQPGESTLRVFRLRCDGHWWIVDEHKSVAVAGLHESMASDLIIGGCVRWMRKNVEVWDMQHTDSPAIDYLLAVEAAHERKA